MKTKGYDRVKVSLQSFLREWLASRPGHFTSLRNPRYPSNRGLSGTQRRSELGNDERNLFENCLNPALFPSLSPTISVLPHHVPSPISVLIHRLHLPFIFRFEFEVPRGQKMIILLTREKEILKTMNLRSNREI
jgi:hypothetical protein